DELMRLGEVARHFRARILVLLAINPLFVNLAFSFMTEFYGFTPALLGAVIWFRTRRAHAASDGALVGLLPAIASGAVIGGTFWVRQYCVLIFPALVASTLLYVLKTRDWRRLWRSLPSLAASGTAFLALVGGYFWYAKTHNLVKGAFEGRLQDTLHFSLLDYQIMGGAYGFYLTAFLFPLLLTWPLSTRRLSRYTRAGAAAFALALALVTIVELRATDDWASLGVHRVFPYLSNIIHNAGVGPNTLTDGFFYRNDKYYAVSRTFWRNVSYGLLGLSALWGFALVALASLRNAPRARRELAAFGSAFAALSLVAVVQAYGGGGFDRYSLPCLFGIVLVLGSLASSEEESIHRPLRVRNLIRKWSAIPFALTCLPLAYFTVAGVHDYFRWNDARWRLVDYALSTGFPSTSINGGYEVNGWLSYDATGLHAVNPDVHRCIGECRCEVPAVLAGLWNCFDDSYRINMSVGPGYDEVMRETPRFWFGRDHSIILSKRRQ
ncbi:MAG TPA: hypothetical protein VFQ35_08940, partial [Polyangiaceae bacterium]|nr:hypothetical protein [Polyangiaceae bacterium]